MNKFNNIEELLKYTEKIKGHTFRDFDKNRKLEKNLKRNKGVLGQIIEEGFYGYPLNNSAKADFDELGVELKVTGFVKNKNGTVSAKERLVLSKIDFNSIVNEEFNFSKLLFKNRKLLIIWYEYEKDKHPADFVIKDFQLYDMDEHGDITIIKNDFEIIKQKVIDGEAHELSEGLTSYLGACPKGIDGFDVTSQPKSTIMAMKRAYTLKNSYMTGVLRAINFAFENDKVEYKTIEEYVFAQISKFIGKTQMEIYEEVFKNKYETKIPKNLNKMISDKIIGKDGELQYKNPLFSKINYVIKNIPINEQNYPLERMSFRNLVLSEFEEEWESSTWKNYFEEVTFIVLLYEGNLKIRNGFRVFKDIKKITFNSDDIEMFGRTYNMVRETIQTHDISKLPYPKVIDGQVLEVAPKGRKNDDAYNHFFDKDVTKVCFMIDKDFLFKKLNEKE